MADHSEAQPVAAEPEAHKNIEEEKVAVESAEQQPKPIETVTAETQEVPANIVEVYAQQQATEEIAAKQADVPAPEQASKQVEDAKEVIVEATSPPATEQQSNVVAVEASQPSTQKVSGEPEVGKLQAEAAPTDSDAPAVQATADIVDVAVGNVATNVPPSETHEQVVQAEETVEASTSPVPLVGVQGQKSVQLGQPEVPVEVKSEEKPQEELQQEVTAQKQEEAPLQPQREEEEEMTADVQPQPSPVVDTELAEEPAPAAEQPSSGQAAAIETKEVSELVQEAPIQDEPTQTTEVAAIAEVPSLVDAKEPAVVETHQPDVVNVEVPLNADQQLPISAEAPQTIKEAQKPPATIEKQEEIAAQPQEPAPVATTAPTDEDFDDFREAEVVEASPATQYLSQLPDYSFMFATQLL